MMKEMSPAIVIVTFNRAKSLRRLLSSLNQAFYPGGSGVPLIISVDHQDSEEHQKVVEMAEGFNWPFGQKKIIIHEKNLGLRKHVLSCGDLTQQYESIIMLEDDIFVSPYFYSYSVEALTFYQESEHISGISLYSHKRNFTVGLPFEIIPDANDVFFLQIASSWGQSWTKKQWAGFRLWYDDDKKADNSDRLPPAIHNWPQSSWLKEYIKYLIATNKYFVYPNRSLTTNFGDSGTHNKRNNVEYQVPLSMSNSYKFIKISESINVYDSFFEISPNALKLLSPHLERYDFSVDLYGTKEIRNIDTEFLLSSKPLKHIQRGKGRSYGMEVKPMTLNIINQIEGSSFFLSAKEEFSDENFFNTKNPLVFYYFYTQIPFKNLIALLVRKIKIKLKG
jgi:glycosyltransferase involved in cell wall biosynthesis